MVFHSHTLSSQESITFKKQKSFRDNTWLIKREKAKPTQHLLGDALFTSFRQMLTLINV